MIVDLAVPFKDSHAGQLSFSLHAPRLPAEHVQQCVVDRFEIELRVLSASHQIVVRHADGELIETVACLPGDGSLPRRRRTCRGALTHEIVSRTSQHEATELHRIVARLVARAQTGDRVLVGRFPGSSDAITAIELQDGAPGGWQTWHAYPDRGELVWTRSWIGRRK